jgi:hypothetical protein
MYSSTYNTDALLSASKRSYHTFLKATPIIPKYLKDPTHAKLQARKAFFMPSLYTPKLILAILSQCILNDRPSTSCKIIIQNDMFIKKRKSRYICPGYLLDVTPACIRPSSSQVHALHELSVSGRIQIDTILTAHSYTTDCQLSTSKDHFVGDVMLSTSNFCEVNVTATVVLIRVHNSDPFILTIAATNLSEKK